MKFNGILVTGNVPSPGIEADTLYRGVSYGVAWPLESMDTSAISSEDAYLIDKINELRSFYYSDGTYPLEVVADFDFARRYVQCCLSHNLSIRTLLCGTERTEPILSRSVMDQLLGIAKRLGYDYAYSSCRYSAVYHDIFPTSPYLSTFWTNLNGYGLFETALELSEYLEARAKVINSAREKYESVEGYEVRVTPLEDHGDFLPIEVWELQWPVL